MLNKAVCHQCRRARLSKQMQEWDEQFPKEVPVNKSSLDLDRLADLVPCVNKMYTLFTDKPPENCPYLLEHILATQEVNDA